MRKSKIMPTGRGPFQLGIAGGVALVLLVSSQAKATLIVTSDQTVSTDLSESTGPINPGFTVSSPATLTVANGGIVGSTFSTEDSSQFHRLPLVQNSSSRVEGQSWGQRISWAS